jgi:hypothetical protein
MFDHVKFGGGDHAASKAFFLKALGPLGAAVDKRASPACSRPPMPNDWPFKRSI